MLLLTRSVGLVVSTVILTACGAASGPSSEDAAELPVIEGLTAPPQSVAAAPPMTQMATPTVVSTTSSAPPTTTIPVNAAAGSDGLEDAPVPSPPASLALDLGPLPNPLPAEAQRDPAAVARQWVGLKVLTSGFADGPLWPYSVAAHLPALSDPTGQYLAGGRLHSVTSDNLTVSARQAFVTVTVDVAGPDASTSTLVYDIELWLATDSDIWLVAFADLQP